MQFVIHLGHMRLRNVCSHRRQPCTQYLHLQVKFQMAWLSMYATCVLSASCCFQLKLDYASVLPRLYTMHGYPAHQKGMCVLCEIKYDVARAVPLHCQYVMLFRVA